MRSVTRKALPFVALALALFVAGHTREHSQRHLLSTQRYEDVYYLPPPQWLKLFSLGHREALAGLVWCRALVYYGDELVHRGAVANLFNYADAILELDPAFQRAYRWVATNAAYRATAATLTDVQKGIEYLERAARIFPDDGEIAWDLAAFYLYELRPLLTDEREREQARLRGLAHLRVASLRGAGPAWLALSTATELERLGQREQQIAFLEEAYSQVSDDRVREEILMRIAELRSASFAEAMAREHAALEAARKRDYPYLDSELFLQVGPKPAFDGLALRLRGFDPVAATEEEAPSAAEGEQPAAP
jgi:tetratricopeptide (TPR) repeat protein